MGSNEMAISQDIQQAVIEKLALLSLEQQRQVLAFAEEIARSRISSSKFRTMFDDAAKDVPTEDWEEIPCDASSNIDQILYGDLGK